jgi:hypothetical protein
LLLNVTRGRFELRVSGFRPSSSTPAASSSSMLCGFPELETDLEESLELLTIDDELGDLLPWRLTCIQGYKLNMLLIPE